METRQTVFQRQLGFGKLGEGRIARWLRDHGFSLIPVYELELESGKGPQLFTPVEAFIAPDLLTFHPEKGVRFIEAKHKSVFSWYRNRLRWTTGIDLRHYEDYKKVQDNFPFEVWILFLHEQSTPSSDDIRHGCPEKCPVGLFGQDLRVLRKTESHQSHRWGSGGMVYWSDDSLRLLAKINEVPA
jgi:hypothetical protein